MQACNLPVCGSSHQCNIRVGLVAANQLSNGDSIGQRAVGETCLLGGNDHHHADPHVEYTVGFVAFHATPGQQAAKEKRHLPAAAVNSGAQSRRKDAGQVVDKAAAGNVGQPFDEDAGLLKGADRRQIGAVRSKQRVDQQLRRPPEAVEDRGRRQMRRMRE